MNILIFLSKEIVLSLQISQYPTLYRTYQYIDRLSLYPVFVIKRQVLFGKGNTLIKGHNALVCQSPIKRVRCSSLYIERIFASFL